MRSSRYYKQPGRKVTAKQSTWSLPGVLEAGRLREVPAEMGRMPMGACGHSAAADPAGASGCRCRCAPGTSASSSEVSPSDEDSSSSSLLELASSSSSAHMHMLLFEKRERWNNSGQLHRTTTNKY